MLFNQIHHPNTFFMRTILTAAFIAIAALASGQSKTDVTTDSVTVYGECGMCKKRIEKNAIAAGALTAVWNEDRKKLVVTFSKKTSLTAIEEKIAAVGHDTQNKTAPKEVYDALPECCQYERKKQ
ncbi:MAG TPA: ATPase [Chitinophagaceae bacterium]|nr:ATPase [Chitinophagaceae bacterium]HAN38004.1 ATPase [Chitinophagaceae bacterium]